MVLKEACVLVKVAVLRVKEVAERGQQKASFRNGRFVDKLMNNVHSIHKRRHIAEKRSAAVMKRLLVVIGSWSSLVRHEGERFRTFAVLRQGWAASSNVKFFQLVSDLCGDIIKCFVQFYLEENGALDIRRSEVPLLPRALRRCWGRFYSSISQFGHSCCLHAILEASL